MKKILAIITVIIVNSSNFSYSQIKEIEISPFKIVQIVTPGSYYHDDGADLIKYPKYEIRDTADSVIVVVPESINRHHTIKLLPGEYVLELQKTSKKQAYKLIINQENYQLFQITRSSQNSDQ
ncbi:MAG: hypothetical protein ACFCUM_03790 [Bacteroidales bacterium]